ncbi:hypothetical protein LF25067_01132 [Limosilactobacillus fermentum]|nr:hypothetical protein LF25067_01132 [Limosilactobacillus fermentum]
MMSTMSNVIAIVTFVALIIATLTYSFKLRH